MSISAFPSHSLLSLSPQINVTTCTAKATAIVPAFFEGVVWFQYRKAKRDEGEPGHHHDWYLNVANLPPDQRSTNMTVTDQVILQHPFPVPVLICWLQVKAVNNGAYNGKSVALRVLLHSFSHICFQPRAYRYQGDRTQVIRYIFGKNQMCCHDLVKIQM